MIEAVASMNNNINQVGLDVDDTQYRGSALEQSEQCAEDG